MSTRKRPPARRDASGECMHLYLTSDATCVHCGMQFRLAWTAPRSWLTAPLRKNLIIAIVAVGLMAGASLAGQSILGVFCMFAVVYFLVRSLFGTGEVFMKHRFSPGRLHDFAPNSKYNFVAMKPGQVFVGTQKYPMDRETFEQFAPNETLLVEYLRWSRLPVAIYRGHLPA